MRLDIYQPKRHFAGSFRNIESSGVWNRFIFACYPILNFDAIRRAYLSYRAEDQSCETKEKVKGWSLMRAVDGGYNMLIGLRSSKQSARFANEEACACCYLNRFYRRRDQSGAVLGTCTPNWWSTSCKTQIFVVRFNKQSSLLSEDQLEVTIAFFEKMELDVDSWDNRSLLTPRH